MAETPLAELKPIVRQWHDMAKPVIETKDFDTTWADFIHAWPRAKLALGTAVAEQAWELSQKAPPCPAAAAYHSPSVRALVAFCKALADAGAGRFFLSSHTAATLLEAPPKTVWQWLNMLVADGVLEKVRAGSQRQATRYRWRGEIEQEGR